MINNPKHPLILRASQLLYLLALILPNYTTANSEEGAKLFSGFFTLLLGGMGLLVGYWTWLANPLLLLSWYYFRKKPMLSFGFAIASCAFALSFLSYTELMYNEAGMMTDITGYLSGYYCWVASTVVMSVGLLYMLVSKKATTEDVMV